MKRGGKSKGEMVRMEMEMEMKKGPHPRVTCSYVKSCDQRQEERKEGRHTRCVSASIRRGSERTIRRAEV